MAICYMAAGGGRNEGRRTGLIRKRRILYVKSHIYRPAGIRSDPRALQVFRTLGVYLVRLASCGNFLHGGGWWAVGKNEGRSPRLIQKRRILFPKRHIYRYVCIRSDPRALLRPRILCVYLVRLVFSGDFLHGGGRWAVAKNEGRRPRLIQKWMMLFAKSHIYRSLGIRSDPRALRFVCIICAVP